MGKIIPFPQKTDNNKKFRMAVSSFMMIDLVNGDADANAVFKLLSDSGKQNVMAKMSEFKEERAWMN